LTQPLCPGCLIASVLAGASDADDGGQDDGPFDIPYHIITLIGGGADRVTYLAQTPAAATLVALTIVGPREDAPAMLARAELYKGALGEVRDPHIARLLDAGAAADRCVYIVEEFVGGPSLAVPACRDKLTAGDRQTVIDQLTAAVGTLHRHGVTHLSLDPSRVKIGVRDGVHATVIGLGIGPIVEGLAADPQQDLDALASLARALDVNR
jgi:serine/threonine protein kinase